MIREHSGINLLRVLSAFLVVFIHVSPEAFGVMSDDWFGINVMASISRVSVPLFFMISGYFALNTTTDININKFLYKKTTRLLPPLVVWSVIYVIYNKTIIDTSTLWGMLTITPAHYHLWFFYTLIPMIFISPMLSKSIKNSNTNQLIYLTLIWLLFSLFPSLIQALQYFINGEDPILKVGKAQLFIAMLGYFLLGGFLKELRITINTKALFIIFILSTLATIISTCIISKIIKSPSQAFFVYYSPFIASGAFSLFVIFDRINIKNNRISKFISHISKLTLGVYLIHPILIDYFKINILESRSVYSLLIMTIIIFVASSVIIFLISKVPLIKKTVL
ncbi:acyltransferase family protein [Klebsiella aerogenes]|uniref:acyltransferase n=1 Tax=Klebsiella aerogenes TaxID=548 RepID=UPI002A80962B|nr:acyltransferase family protein [Klebsiella aerogenes]WPR95477.1 acyltransferase family protein [Klebsiella aerogenes]